MPSDTLLGRRCVIWLTVYCLVCHFSVPVCSPFSLFSHGESHLLISNHIFFLVQFEISLHCLVSFSKSWNPTHWNSSCNLTFLKNSPVQIISKFNSKLHNYLMILNICFEGLIMHDMVWIDCSQSPIFPCDRRCRCGSWAKLGRVQNAHG